MTKQHEKLALQREETSAVLWRLIVDIQDADQAERELLVKGAVDKLACFQPPRWLDSCDVVAHFPFSLNWLQHARLEGTGPPFHRIQGKRNPRSRVFYHSDDIEAFLAQCRVVPQPQN